LFCGSDAQSSVEHVIPKWARKTFAIKGWVTAGLRDVPGAPVEEAGRLPNLNITLKDVICEPCNTVWLSGIERRVAPVLKPMIVLSQPETVLDTAAQSLVALWAVKTCLLLELAFRQMYPNSRSLPGYVASNPELRWLRQRGEPPPRSRVFIGAWDCEREVPLNYGPSEAALPGNSGARVAGHFATFSLGFVLFQVFTVDFVAASMYGSPEWHRWPEKPWVRAALPRIWPPPDKSEDTIWPPPAFRRGEWSRIVSWEGQLHPMPSSDGLPG
jgi:hypothetical protein